MKVVLGDNRAENWSGVKILVCPFLANKKILFMHLYKIMLASLVLFNGVACESTPEVVDDSALVLNEDAGEKAAPVKSSTPKTEKTTQAPQKPSPLPLPERISLFELQNFLRETSPAYAVYGPLGKEYALFFKIFGDGQSANDEESKSIKLRIAEDYARCHWVFVYGLWDVSNYLVNQSKNSLQIDREKNFVSRLKTLSFLAASLDEIQEGNAYLTLTRKMYISLSQKHFNRSLKEREAAK